MAITIKPTGQPFNPVIDVLKQIHNETLAEQNRINRENFERDMLGRQFQHATDTQTRQGIIDGKGNVVMPAQSQQPERINSFADILKREVNNIYNNEMNNETQRLPLIDYAKRGQEMAANNQAGIRAFNTGQDGAEWQAYRDPLDAELKKSQINRNNSEARYDSGGSRYSDAYLNKLVGDRSYLQTQLSKLDPFDEDYEANKQRLEAELDRNEVLFLNETIRSGRTPPPTEKKKEKLLLNFNQEPINTNINYLPQFQQQARNRFDKEKADAMEWVRKNPNADPIQIKRVRSKYGF